MRNSRHGKRDYTVQAMVIHIDDQPFTPHLLRTYFVIGTLDKVAHRDVIVQVINVSRIELRISGLARATLMSAKLTY